MFSFLLPFASKIIGDAVAKIPDDAELGDKLIDLCLVILGKAVKMTKTSADDKLLETVKEALQSR
ncbi:MAG: hypothetical protein CM15mV13_1700 [uncultured marine virus]|jgi:hypothetical protein|nr:MAG: hypothetical protein CM15mV13_1700 [uncultured marine virus]|tara:strand:- start:756 stop:950 length:195 start_codon:yes stop_codon:yes gene_type:complete